MDAACKDGRKAKVRDSSMARSPKPLYTTKSYQRAILRACRAAGVEEWSSHQLRHRSATEIRGRLGDAHARAALGQGLPGVTGTYTRVMDVRLALEAAEKMG